MVELTANRCYVLWTLNKKRDRVSHDPTVYTNVASLVSQGESRKDKGLIADYGYSIVMCPQIGGEEISTPPLTTHNRAPSVEL